ncbi:MAG TPA: glutamate-1-semialdehyde 2,1-aminomutase [Zeimonas sp.]
MPDNASEFSRACEVLVGGVNSAVRAFRAVGGTPRFIDRAEGAYLWDVEGKRYIDYLGSWGPMIAGHTHPHVVEAVERAARRGLSFGAPNVLETELAERLCALFPQIERVRFTSSGTEATMSALRLARGFTGRDAIVKFEGCYHGTGDSLLVKAGSGALAFGTPSSAGVPASTARHTLVATYNDADSVAQLFRDHRNTIACVIVEPIAGNMNLVKPRPGFLEALRTLCDENDALLVFDEVMSGFRVAHGGAQQRCGVVPDISTFGKVIGGGMPVGAIGGPARILERFSPMGPVYQAGTLSGNPIAMAAGLATLDLVAEPGFYERLESLGDRLVGGLNQVAREAGAPMCAQHLGALAGLYLLPSPPTDFAQTQMQDVERFRRFYHAMLDEGVYLPPSPVEAFFFSSAHTEADVDATIAAARRALAASA